MKRIMMILMLLLALQTVQAVEFVSTESALNASLLYYQPVPAQPGDLLDVWIQVQNIGGSATGPGTVTLLENNIFVVENERDRVKSFAGIPPQQSFLVKTKVRVSRDAVEGESNLAIRIRETDAASTVEKQLPITIVGTSSALSIVSAVTTPEEVLPGETAHVELVLRNLGTTQVRNVDVTLDLSDLDLVPSGSSNSKAISILPSGKDHTFTFDIVSFPDTEPKAYRIPVTIEYDDEQGNANEQEESVGIVIGAKPELLVYFDSVGLTPDRLEGEVVLRFVNKGLSEIKLLEAEILESDDVQVTSETPVVYVGNIDADDYESTDIRLRIGQGTSSVPVRVAYKDALNRQYEDRLDIPLRLQQSQQEGGMSPLVWIAVVAALGLGYWYWKRRKK